MYAFAPRHLRHVDDDSERAVQREGNATAEGQVVAALQSIVVAAVLARDWFPGAVNDAQCHWGERQQVDAVVRVLVALEKPDGQARRDEVAQLAFRAAAIRTDADRFLHPGMRHD